LRDLAIREVTSRKQGQVKKTLCKHVVADTLHTCMHANISIHYGAQHMMLNKEVNMGQKRFTVKCVTSAYIQLVKRI